MYIHEYGNRSDPIVILLAPMMVSGDNLYHMMRPHLKGSYHIIAPDQGGHGNSGPYISADAEYLRVLCARGLRGADACALRDG